MQWRKKNIIVVTFFMMTTSGTTALVGLWLLCFGGLLMNGKQRRPMSISIWHVWEMMAAKKYINGHLDDAANANARAMVR
jgi:hypothetical protein